MNRKEFLKLTSTSALGLFMSAPMIGKAFKPSELNTGSNLGVLIIGTGYGAAVAALRLAQAGKRCLMLEMGMDWEKSGMKFSSMAWARKESTWLRNTTIAPFGNYRLFEKFTGALDRLDFEHVKVYAGRGVGGGSLVNGGMSVMPKREYFEEIFPELNSEAFYSTYFPKANKELGVSIIPEDYYQSSEYYQFSRTGEEEGKKAGYSTLRVPNVYDYYYMQREEKGDVTRSAMGGEVIYGNNHGKRDLTKTYLKKAIETGNVTILGLHKADLIIQNDDGTYTVKVDFIDTKGEVQEVKEYKTEKLFLGAGSLGTTELLLKSRAKGTLKSLNTEVGKYWGNNGNTMCARNFITQSLGSRQATIPAAGIDGWTSGEDAIFAEIAPFPLGIDVRTALYLVINRVSKYGTFTYNKEKEELELDWDSRHNKHMRRNAKTFMERMNKANGGKISAILFNKGIGEDICYHPLGGCVLGKATDLHGRLNGCPGIYVTDGALIPASIGVNPYVTITAVAEHCMENIIQNDLSIINKTSNEVRKKLSPKIFPIPFVNHVELQFSTDVDTDCEAAIYNSSGKKVAYKKSPAKQGKTSLTMENLGHLKSGSYILKLRTGRNLITETIWK